MGRLVQHWRAPGGPQPATHLLCAVAIEAHSIGSNLLGSSREGQLMCVFSKTSIAYVAGEADVCRMSYATDHRCFSAGSCSGGQDTDIVLFGTKHANLLVS